MLGTQQDSLGNAGCVEREPGPVGIQQEGFMHSVLRKWTFLQQRK